MRETVNIVSTLGLLFSFSEEKGSGNGGWISLNALTWKSFLQVYAKNYKGFKDKFLCVRGGNKCPQMKYVLDGHHRFPIYRSNNLIPASGFDYEKLDALEVRALDVLDAFRMIKVWDLLDLDEDPEQVFDFLGNS